MPGSGGRLPVRSFVGSTLNSRRIACPFCGENLVQHDEPDLGMTNKQRAWMADIAYRYRRQLPKGLAPLDVPTFDEIAPLMTDDELSDALGAKQEMEPADDDLVGVIVTGEPSADTDRAYSSPEQIVMSVILE
jgi:hypothetical protein